VVGAYALLGSALHDMAFRKVFNRIMGGFNMHHALHECQHTRSHKQ
jgi:hypothetical protein